MKHGREGEGQGQPGGADVAGRCSRAPAGQLAEEAVMWWHSCSENQGARARACVCWELDTSSDLVAGDELLVIPVGLSRGGGLGQRRARRLQDWAGGEI